MINDQLVGYIRQQLSLKVSKEVITGNLKKAGWTDADLSEAFAIVAPTPTLMSVPVSPIASTLTPNIYNQPAKSKKIFPVICVVLLLGALGSGAYAYYSGFFVSLPSLTSEAIDSARATTTGSYDVTLNIDLSEMKDITSGLSQMLAPGIISNQISLTGKGSYDVTDSQNKKSASNIFVDMGGLSLEAEFRVLNDTFYAALTKAPALASIPMLAQVTAYEGKWFSYSYKSEDEQIGGNPLSKFTGVGSNIASKLTPEQEEDNYKLSRD